MKRREFIKKAGIGATAAAAASTIAAPNIIAAKKYRWRMVTTWPPKLPLLQTGAERFAEMVKKMSGGRLTIKVYAGGELVPPLETFQAVSQGTVQAGSGAAYYWAGKTPAAQWFAAVPFGLNAQGNNAWFYGGNGLKLWEETYAPFNVVPRPLGNTGVQMGGWFRKEIKSIGDFKGLKMRIPGLGGKVLAKAGGTVVLLAGGEIFTSLERGVIDATEWVGPMHDLRMGFYKAAKYYYAPGWHEPGTTLEAMFNKKAYDSLPKELQVILDVAAAESNIWTLAEFDAQNGGALQQLISKHKVNVKRFPAKVMADLKKLADETLEEEASKDKQAKKVHEDFKKFKDQVGIWYSVSEKSYFDVIAKKYSL
ncbi:MAG: ABC transporter substrate-binding protein [Proteobacteria bacterium]|nr:ABC transporter substrate-binding protein [Pseudomonadota bacterium]